MTPASASVPAPRDAETTRSGSSRPLLVAAGDNVVDCYPQLRVLYPGGNAVNVAVNAARLGTTSAYIGVVGTDSAGRLVETSLRAEGVDVSRLRVVEGRNAAATVHLDAGNRHFVGGDPGVSRFRVDQDDLALIRRAAITHTGECSMLEEDLSALASNARILSFDFSERDLDYVEAYAPHVQIATLSRPTIGTREAVQTAMAVSDFGPKTVAITMGERGALVLHEGHVMTAAAPATVDLIDTLGAGDAFIARLLVGIARGEPMQSLLAAATTYASSTCLTKGAFGYESPLTFEPPGSISTAQ